jgi:hypothetical protein
MSCILARHLNGHPFNPHRHHDPFEPRLRTITSRGLLRFYFSSSLAPDQPDDEQQNDCTDRGADDLAGDASDGDIAG